MAFCKYIMISCLCNFTEYGYPRPMSRRVYTSHTLKFTALAMVMMVLIKVFLIDGIGLYRAAPKAPDAPVEITMVDVTPPAVPGFDLTQKPMILPSLDSVGEDGFTEETDISGGLIGPVVPEGWNPPRSAAAPAPAPDVEGIAQEDDAAQAIVAPTQPIPVPAVTRPKAQAQENTAPLAAGQHPKIVIIIDDMGVARKYTQEIIDLPAPLTLAFLPYAQGLPELTAAASSKGHELIIHVPMEPMNPDLDLGPYGLTGNLGKDEFIRRMDDHIFNAFEGYVGINNHMGSRLTQNHEAMGWVMEALKKRGLFFVDSKTIGASIGDDTAAEYGVPYAGRDVFLDHYDTLESVQKALFNLEAVARRKGVGIAIGHPKPHTIAALKGWMAGAKARGFDFVPVSQVLHGSMPHPAAGAVSAAVAVEDASAVSPVVTPVASSYGPQRISIAAKNKVQDGHDAVHAGQNEPRMEAQMAAPDVQDVPDGMGNTDDAINPYSDY